MLRHRLQDLSIALAESGVVPDAVVRAGVRRVIASRARELRAAPADALERHVAAMSAGPVATDTPAANSQHYEVPAAFFEGVLGARLKYSCGHWPIGVDSLDASEEAALDQVVRRAGIADGQRVADLGCGWGSLSLYLLERFPHLTVTAVSSSASQGAFIRERAAKLGAAGRLTVKTLDVAELAGVGPFDRVVSIEMFEHLRDWETMLGRIASWLAPEGRAFVHVFSHRDTPYLYEDRDASDWMARHFFTGGQMPSRDLMHACAGPLRVADEWHRCGLDYARTANAWLAEMDAAEARLRPVIAAAAKGTARPGVAWQRWRLFFMACAELFAFDGGGEWGISQYLLAPP